MAFCRLVLLVAAVITGSSQGLSPGLRQDDDPWLPRQLGRFDLPHAAFVEAFPYTDPVDDPAENYTLYISTFNAAALYFHDPVYYIRSPGKFLDFVDGWGDIMEQMGPGNTAYWPNYPVKIPKEVSKQNMELEAITIIRKKSTKNHTKLACWIRRRPPDERVHPSREEVRPAGGLQRGHGIGAAKG